MKYKNLQDARDHRNKLQGQCTAIQAQLADLGTEDISSWKEARALRKKKAPLIKTLSENARELRLIKEYIHNASQAENNIKYDKTTQIRNCRVLLRRALKIMQRQDIDLASDITEFLLDTERLDKTEEL